MFKSLIIHHLEMTKMKLGKLLFISVFSLAFFLALAQNILSTTIYVLPAMLTVYANDYPSTTNTVTYAITVKNVNDFPVNVTLTKSGEITGLVNILEPNFVLQPNEIKNVDTVINLNGPAYASGLITVYFDAVGQYPVNWDIGVGINGRAVPSGKQCSGSIASCGVYPDCQDLTKLNGCSNGYYRTYFCSSNQPQFTSTCTNYCCQQFYGSQGSCQGVACVGPPQPPLKSITLNVTDGGNAKSALISLFAPGTSNLINSTNVTGLGSISYSNSTADFKIEYDSSKLTVLLKGLNLDNITTTSDIILDSVSPSIPNVTLRRAYKISIPFSSAGITLTIKYSDLSVNENSLYLYRCGSYDLVNGICNETWIPKGMTKVNGYVVADLDSFSAYAIGESQQAITTTIPITTTTQSSSSSGDSGSSGGSSGGGGGGGGGGSGATSTTTTTVPITTTTEVPVTTTTQVVQENQQNQGPSIFTGLASLTSNNPIWFGLPVTAAAGIFLSWKFYFKTRLSTPSYSRRVPNFKIKKRKNSKDTKLIFQ
jgi:uncharacterized membrane protein YgcG